MRACTIEMSEAKSRQYKTVHEQYNNKILLVVMRLGVTPVPIPNTMVKP